MTEDNITTPLIIIGKGFNAKKRIFQRVSLLDINQLIKCLVSNKVKSSKLYKLSNSQVSKSSVVSSKLSKAVNSNRELEGSMNGPWGSDSDHVN